MIIVESKRKKPATILKKYPDAILADVTSGAKDGLIKLSPFYPHGDIPVPFSEGYTAACVEAIWQGLKVFEGCDVDTSLFLNLQEVYENLKCKWLYNNLIDIMLLLNYMQKLREVYKKVVL